MVISNYERYKIVGVNAGLKEGVNCTTALPIGHEIRSNSYFVANSNFHRYGVTHPGIAMHTYEEMQKLHEQGDVVLLGHRESLPMVADARVLYVKSSVLTLRQLNPKREPNMGFKVDIKWTMLPKERLWIAVSDRKTINSLAKKLDSSHLSKNP